MGCLRANAVGGVCEGIVGLRAAWQPEASGIESAQDRGGGVRGAGRRPVLYNGCRTSGRLRAEREGTAQPARRGPGERGGTGDGTARRASIPVKYGRHARAGENGRSAAVLKLGRPPACPFGGKGFAWNGQAGRPSREARPSS